MLKGVGPAALRKVWNVPGFASATIGELTERVPALRKAVSHPSAWGVAEVAAQAQLEQARAHGAFVLSNVDPAYPRLLGLSPDDPCILFVKGHLAPPSLGAVAVIGTREPTSHGGIITRRLVDHLVSTQKSIVSGLALGCDGIAHQAAIDAGGHTVAVLAHGLQMISPASHKTLAADILDAGGALVSEFPFGTRAMGPQFVQRDKTQAGLAEGVVMVQSDLQGGSLYASRAALSYGRWLAVPFPTSVDLQANAPKIQANLVMADGSQTEKADLLRCTVSALDRLVILRSRADYRLIPNTTTSAASLDDRQPGLL